MELFVLELQVGIDEVAGQDVEDSPPQHRPQHVHLHSPVDLPDRVVPLPADELHGGSERAELGAQVGLHAHFRHVYRVDQRAAESTDDRSGEEVVDHVAHSAALSL